MDKKAFSPVPGLTWELLRDRLVRHGIPAAALGGGVAGLAHLVSNNAQQNAAKKKTQQDNTLVIEVPGKTASAPTTGQYVWDAPLAAGAMAAGGAVGYKVVDSILRKHREKKLQDQLNSVKQEYAGFLGQRLSDEKTAAEDEYPLLNGMILSLSSNMVKTPVEQVRKEAAMRVMDVDKIAASPETLLTMLTSLPGLAALATGTAAHNYYYNRQQDIDRGIEKEEADSMGKAPRFVKIVSAPAEASPEAGNKEIQKRKGLPVDDLLQKAAQEPESALSIVQKVLDPTGAAIAAGTKEDLKPVVKPEEPEKPIVNSEDIQEIDPNTTVYRTKSGPVQVDALDPAAQKALEAHKETILRSLAVGMNIGA